MDIIRRELEIEKFPGKRNPLNHKPHAKNPLKVVVTSLILLTAKRMPLGLKNILYRLAGIEVGNNVNMGMNVSFDHFYPEKITIGANTIIGRDTDILAHEATQDEFRTGRVKIGNNVLIGAKCLLLPGVEIKDGAKVSAFSLVNRDVEENEFVGGVPIRNLEQDEER